LIIDHGDGYMSLYGQNQALYKEVGEWVASGEVVATLGASGGHTEAGLYFEIRHNGQPVNPVRWCAGKPDRVSG
jgi:septal ring factor EnvC (AmiA/AmiB activator)